MTLNRVSDVGRNYVAASSDHTRETDTEQSADSGVPVNNSAVLFGLGTMISWGFWIVFGDVASNSIDPKTAAFISYATAAVVTGVFVLVSDASLAVTNRGLFFASIAGVAAAIGVVSTFIGVTVGPTAVVSTIGGMYFITATVISTVAFDQPLSSTKAAGIGLAVVAIILVNQ